MSRKQRYEEEKKKLSEEKFSPVRGDNFRLFIHGLLTKEARLPEDKATLYLEHLSLFEQAFTHSTFDPEKNYEALEILGDSTLNFCVVYYLTQRFPQLMCNNGSGVGTLARLKINLVSKSIFSKCAQKLGFSDHIASDMLTRREDMDSLLEDTFEAFQGALLRIISLCDSASTKRGYLPSPGPSYRIISNFFDGMEISLKYDDLYDAKTRLKQLLESMHVGCPQYHHSQEYDPNGKIIFTTRIKIGNAPTEWGVGKGFRKNESEQNACEHAIVNLKKSHSDGGKPPVYHHPPMSGVKTITKGIDKVSLDKNPLKENKP